MYLRKVTIENVRSINKFEMEFKEGQEAGWHVIIGDNGSGKTTALRVLTNTIIRSVGPTHPKPGIYSQLEVEEIPINIFELFGSISKSTPQLERKCFFQITDESKKIEYIDVLSLLLFNHGEASGHYLGYGENNKGDEYLRHAIMLKGLLLAFGPIRNFSDSKSRWDEILSGKPRTKRVINLFYDDATFYETGAWLYDLDYKRLKEEVKNDTEAKSGKLLEAIFKLINPQPNPNDSLLPYGVKINGFDDNGKLQLIDGYGATVYLTDLSAGYRSVLALVFEIIRHMIDQFGVDEVFKEGQGFIDCEGVVLIDEIDAHLHPTWQTRIGQWFTKFFPKIQFIVTTHSPLICRACEKGSIWRLAAPGSDIPSGEITGTDRDRLIFGNILDAYGTEVFGENVTQSEAGQKKAERLAELTFKSYDGIITCEEEKEYFALKKQMPTLRIKTEKSKA